MVMERHYQVVERQFQVVERQTQVAERRSGPFRLNLTTDVKITRVSFSFTNDSSLVFYMPYFPRYCLK